MSRALAIDLIRSRNHRVSRLGVVEALTEMVADGKLAPRRSNGHITSLEVCQEEGLNDYEKYLVVTLFRNGLFSPERRATVRGDELRRFGKQTALSQQLIRPLPYQGLLWLLVITLFAVPYYYLVTNSDASFTVAITGLAAGFGSSVALAMFISRPLITKEGKQAMAAVQPLPAEWQHFAKLCENAIRIYDMPERR